MATSAAGDASETPVLGERKASSSRAMVEDTTIGACWVCQHVSFPAALPTGVLLPNSSQSDWSVSGCENDATSCWRSRLRRVMKLLKLTAVCESVARRSWRSGIKPITTATATFRAQPLFLRSHNPNRLGRSVRICIPTELANQVAQLSTASYQSSQRRLRSPLSPQPHGVQRNTPTQAKVVAS